MTLLDRVGYITKVSGYSMQPTLNPDWRDSDYVLLNKLIVRYFSLVRGDLVSIIDPYHPDTLIVKRIVGLECTYSFLFIAFVVVKCHLNFTQGSKLLFLALTQQTQSFIYDDTIMIDEAKRLLNVGQMSASRAAFGLSSKIRKNHYLRVRV